MNMSYTARILYGCLCVLALVGTGHSEAPGTGPKPTFVGVGAVVGKINVPGVGEVTAKEVGRRPGSKFKRRAVGDAKLPSMTNQCGRVTPWSKYRYEKCNLSCECLSSCCGSDGACNLSIFSQGRANCKNFFK